MLPFKYRTNKIQKIEFRNLHFDSYGKYFMQVEYMRAATAERLQEKVVFESDECSENCISPSFELSNNSVRQNP